MFHSIEMYFSVTVWAYQLEVFDLIRATITLSDNMVDDKNVHVGIAATLASRATGID
jgi:hypothetical protein